MGVKQMLWSLDEKRPLSLSKLDSEEQLEYLIKDNIDILEESWLVIGNQIPTDLKKRLDILCIDSDGNLVVVELKKDKTPREVTAQTIEYAEYVSRITVPELSDIYRKSTGGKDLSEAYNDKFGIQLNESEFNPEIKMVIVATEMDSSTERIIKYLRSYEIDINILFFQIFQEGKKKYISRAWFVEDYDIEENVSKKSEIGEWNKEYYVSYGGSHRSWDDAVKYGFISAGGGKWYSKTLFMLHEGDRIWVRIPQKGYVGVGTVKEAATQSADATFVYKGKNAKMKDLPLKGNYYFENSNTEKAEYIVKVEWKHTVSEKNAVQEFGFFGNENSVCRPKNKKWDITVKRLMDLWGIQDLKAD
ncbi:MAG: endonuclease NucS [Lachnospiraceae bacterium]|nr:endonuclease NucS [Lachnospiraceae bacterium]